MTAVRPTAKRTTRCVSVWPNDASVRCIHTSTPHQTHSGWDGEGRRHEWLTLVGPRTPDEWRAVAWSFTAGLGVKIYYDIGDVCLRVDHKAVAKWWDEQTPEFRRELVASHHASVMEE